MTRICRNGHETRGVRRCHICHRRAQARYERTAKGKATIRRYRITPKGAAQSRSVSFRYYRRNSERVKEQAAKWYAANRERRTAQLKRYRAAQKAAFGSERMAFWGRQARHSA